MGGSSKKQTVGYKYYLGMHLIMCHGPVDRLLRIRADKRVAWQGDQQGTGRVTINAEDLFGGESREGGISGAVDLEMGLPTQGKNSYLQSQLGSVLPNFRGVVGAVLRQVYLGMNPYLKTLDWRFSRVHVRQNGLVQWYDSKAEIVGTQALSGQIGPLSTGWKYLITSRTDSADYSSPSFDDSTWPEGQMPFASAPGQPYAAANGFPPSMNTNWPLQSKLWLRRKFPVTVNSTIAMEVFIDNQAWVWVNGHLLVDGNDTTQSKVSFNIPASIINVGENTIVMMGLDDAQTSSGDYSYAAFKLAQTGLPQYDMNPAHIIRECLTDPDWGMGYQDSDIDDVAFMRAADTLYDEEMGMSLLWSSQTPIEDFINEVVKHISATLYVDRTSGKFVLKLIRDDYTRETLPVLDEYNISKVEGASRPTLGELVNSVTAVYWEAETGENAGITVQDQALIQMQGAVINTTLQYPGFTNGTLAAKAALRALRSLSTPLLSCTVYADRSAASLNIGDVFRLSWPSLEVDDTVMRVTAMALGDGKANTVKLTVVEDAFSFPEVSVVLPSEGAYDGTSVEPLPAVDRLVFEVPYLELVQVMSQTDVDARLDVDTAMGWVGAAALRPLSGVINARMMVDNGAGYAEIGALEFCPGAELSADVGYLDTVLPITGGVDLDQVQLGTWAQVGTEIMAVTALTDTSVTVKRGCLDTQPKTHAAGDTVFFWDVYAHGDSTEYVSSDVVSVKLLTVAGQGQLALSAAPSDSVTIVGRAARPYPPANVKINDEYYPASVTSISLNLQWSHRDRKQQTAGLVGFYENSIGPEEGVTYSVEVKDSLNAIVFSESGITDDNKSIPDSSLPSDVLTLTLWAVRDSIESFQKFEHSFEFISSVSYILDDLTDKAYVNAAYSLRRLFAAATYAIQIRRSSDSATLDVGFDSNGELDTASISSFVGSHSAYVTKWYDQSTNAAHVVQTSTSAQPVIVNSGTLVTKNSKPAISFNGTSQYLKVSKTNLLSGLDTGIFSSVIASSANLNNIISFGVTDSTKNYQLLHDAQKLCDGTCYNYTFSVDTLYRVSIKTKSGTSNTFHYENNVQIGNHSYSSANNGSYLIIGAWYSTAGYFWNGVISEVILINGAYISDDDRTSLWSDQNTFYSLA